MINTTNPDEHKEDCNYLDWYNKNARWQPAGQLSELVKEIMLEELCECESVEAVK